MKTRKQRREDTRRLARFWLGEAFWYDRMWLDEKARAALARVVELSVPENME